ncbi:DUF3309 domain-containing protein [Desulfolutivibrio sulfodismutans]|uniref:DUF3309 domain-containing protein n=1 Tax=Desulfolutivibrio sulfodismutans TaxID=63561 RepID=UPI0028686EA5|nr:DUF3309 domain-containing protein [Desulfolutivibrio sulfodismutans]
MRPCPCLASYQACSAETEDEIRWWSRNRNKQTSWQVRGQTNEGFGGLCINVFNRKPYSTSMIQVMPHRNLQRQSSIFFSYDICKGECLMSITTILLIVLVLMLLGIIPIWPHSRSWGYGPSGVIGLIVVILVILFLLGKI